LLPFEGAVEGGGCFFRPDGGIRLY
jgi:hypothetical protein